MKQVDITGCDYKSIIIGAFEKYIVEINNQKYLFKLDKTNNNCFKSNICSIGEVFVSYLSKNLHFNCVDACFGFHKNLGEGALIKSYLTNDIVEKYSCTEISKFRICHMDKSVEISDSNYFPNKTDDINSLMTTLKTMVKYLDHFVLNPNIEEELVSMSLVDYMLSQKDRFARNIEFLITEADNRNKQINLAPMFDNGMIFKFGYDKDVNLNCHFLKEKNAQYFKSTVENSVLVPHLYKGVTIEEENSLIARDLVKYGKKYTKIEGMLQDFISMDIKEVVKDFEEEYNINIQSEYKDTMIDMFEYKQNSLLLAYKEQQIEDEELENI